ncbi:MAG: hypothetical protein NT065_05255 [Chlamydiae bacterium]|nr:hypothetical protein [Chlamydiota bacterium]
MMSLAAAGMTPPSSVGDYSCKKCIGDSVFGTGYAVSLTGIGIGLFNASPTMAMVSLFNCLIGGAGHFLWRGLAGIDASGEVNEAADIALQAAGKVTDATVQGVEIARKVSTASREVFEGVGKMQAVIDSTRADEVGKSAEEIKELSDHIFSHNGTMKEQLDGLKGVLKPLMGFSDSLQKILADIRRGARLEEATLAELKIIDKQFDKARAHMEANLDRQAKGITREMNAFSEAAVATLALIRDNNQVLLRMLSEKNAELERSLQGLTLVANRVDESHEDRASLIERMDALEQTNLALHRELDSVLTRVSEERQGWDLNHEVTQAQLGQTEESIQAQQERLASFISTLSRISIDFKAPASHLEMERDQTL